MLCIEAGEQNKIKLLRRCFGRGKRKKTVAGVTERETENMMSRCQMGRIIFE